MSALGDRLRERKGVVSVRDYSARRAYDDAARLADEHEAATLAESAQGRGPHAAAVLRWAAERHRAEGWGWAADACIEWADEAER